MGLVMKEQGGIAGPMIMCDACGERLVDAQEALYLWRDGAPDIYFAHKGKCDRAVSARMGFTPPRKPPWEELSLLPVYLALNAGIDLDTARHQAEILGGIEP